MTGETSRLERLVAVVLGTGLRISLIFLALGLGLALIPSAAAAADHLLRAGLIILMTTPMARVVVSAASFAVEGDWKYFFITLSVLAVLAISVIAALNIG